MVSDVTQDRGPSKLIASPLTSSTFDDEFFLINSLAVRVSQHWPDLVLQQWLENN